MTDPVIDQPPDAQPRPANATPPRLPFVRQWSIPFAVVGAIVLTIIIASVVSSGGTSGTPAPSMTQLEAARYYCTAGDLADGGYTLVLDMKGEDFGSGTATFDNVTCVLGFLDAPTSVTSRIDSTRALDGMQDAAWGALSAAWTYHPDAGLDITITDN